MQPTMFSNIMDLIRSSQREDEIFILLKIWKDFQQAQLERIENACSQRVDEIWEMEHREEVLKQEAVDLTQI